jgi:hypothetical protein
MTIPPGKVHTFGPIVFHTSRQCVLFAIAIRPRFGMRHWRNALWVNIRRSLGLA